MRASTCAAFAAVCLTCPAFASIDRHPNSTYPPVWTAAPVAQAKTIHYVRRHRLAPRHSPSLPKSAPADLVIVKLTNELIEFRREMAELRTQIRGETRAPAAFVPGWDLAARLNLANGLNDTNFPAPRRLASLPDLRQPMQEPALPVPVPIPFGQDPIAIDDRRVVVEARAYLCLTATPGYTMTRQGCEVAIGRLHPSFAVKLAAGIRQARAQGLDHAGIYSAYRPPAFGVGGFGNKFNSLHSYGLAADMTGIGGPGSPAAHRWKTIVKTVGLYLPYGPNNRAEFNHTQLIPQRVAMMRLRETITAAAPKDLHVMWAASGVREFVDDAKKESVRSSARLLPENNWP